MNEHEVSIYVRRGEAAVCAECGCEMYAGYYFARRLMPDGKTFCGGVCCDAYKERQARESAS